MRPIRAIIASVLVASSVPHLTGCRAGGVGDPCIPEDEYEPTFSGYSLGEVNIETRSIQCETRVCLVNHFQGRVSCPYGQSEEDLGLDPTDPARCRVPGTDGAQAGDAVTVPVKAWLPARTPEDAVYCSCRCDGPDKDTKYCDCPSGFSCEPLIDDLGFSEDRELIGSYCIRKGTAHDRTMAATVDCRHSPTQEGCPGEPFVNP